MALRGEHLGIIPLPNPSREGRGKFALTISEQLLVRAQQELADEHRVSFCRCAYALPILMQEPILVDQPNKPPLKGCYIATLTPFDRHNQVDTGAIESHTQWLLGAGIDGLCPCGTTGEFLFLSNQEKMLIVEHTLKAASGKVPVIAGVWASSLAEVRDLTAGAANAGAAGVFLPPPIYYPADDEAIYSWYANVRDASILPVFAYNIPQYAANTVSLECLDRLFTNGIIAGVKDSSGKADRVSALVSRFGENHTVFAASDGFASEGRRIGADGFISAIGNAAPALFAKLWEGDDSLQPKVDALRTALKQIGSIPALKYLLATLGFPFGASRIPCSELSDSQQSLLDNLSRELGS